MLLLCSIHDKLKKVVILNLFQEPIGQVARMKYTLLMGCRNKFMTSGNTTLMTGVQNYRAGLPF